MKITLKYRNSSGGWSTYDDKVWLCHDEVGPLFRPDKSKALRLCVNGRPHKKKGEMRLSFGYRDIDGDRLPSAIVLGRKVEIADNTYGFAKRNWGQGKRTFDVYVRKV